MLVLVLCAALFAPAASASSSDRNYYKVQRIVSDANATILSMVRTAQRTPYDDTQWLISATNKVARDAKRQASALGYELGCSYTTYIVDGRSVTIDPLYVINPPKGTGTTKD